MRKKQQIVIHKNLQCGKTAIQEYKKLAQHIVTNRFVNDINTGRHSKKLLSQQKHMSSKSKNLSNQKLHNKQNRQWSSSVRKSKEKKSKKKSQGVKESKKSIKGIYFQDKNQLAFYRKNIYTTVGQNKPNRQKSNKAQNKASNKCSEKQQSFSSGKNRNSLIEPIVAQSIGLQSLRQDVVDLVEEIKQSEFSNLHKLKMHCLDFIFTNRIVKDEQYDRLYELMVAKFPHHKEIFKSILFQILSSLDN